MGGFRVNEIPKIPKDPRDDDGRNRNDERGSGGVGFAAGAERLTLLRVICSRVVVGWGEDEAGPAKVMIWVFGVLLFVVVVVVVSAMVFFCGPGGSGIFGPSRSCRTGGVVW